MSDDALANQIASLLQETGSAHHQAFLETDGFDPEWPLWYAGYLQEKLGRLLNHEFTRSELTYQLIRLDKAYLSQGRKIGWPEYYARQLIEAYTQ